MATREELERGMEPVPFQRIDREGAVAHFLRSTGSHPRVRPLIEAEVDKVIAELQVEERLGDQLWICKSRYIGPFAGHEGLGVVRHGAIVRYKGIIDY